MKTVSLSGSPRENVGKKDAKGLRKQGLVPCVVYGGGEQIHFFLDERDFSKIIFTPDTNVANITIGDKEISTLLQDVQYHPVSDKVLHADFLEIKLDKPVKTSLPVKSTGSAVGVLKGGSMKQLMRKVAVLALVEDIPDFIELDISKLDIGDSINIRDLKVDKVKFLDRPEDVIISVKVTRIAVDEEEDEEEEGEEGEGAAEGEDGDKPAEGGEKKPDEGGDKRAGGGDKRAGGGDKHAQ